MDEPVLSDGAIQFQLHNPDGNKYEFAKHYLMALSYWWENIRRSRGAVAIFLGDLESDEQMAERVDQLVLDNANLRVARNFLKKYQQADNGLILKVTHLFQMACDEQVDLNNQEKLLWHGIGDPDEETQPQAYYLQEQQQIADQRKASMLKLLEASMLLNKVLISSEPDAFGEFTRLGITYAERQKLLYRLDAFYEEAFQGGLRPGQSVLEGSIAVIKEVLEDGTWNILDG